MQGALNTGPLRLSLLVLCLLALPTHADAVEIQWRSWGPRVVDLGVTESATLTVVVDSDPATLEVALTTNGCVSTTELETIPLVPVAANTYEATLTEAQLLHAYLDGDTHSIVGCLKLFGEKTSHVIVNVRTEGMPDVPILQLAPDAQASPHVLNLRDDDLLLGAHPSADRLIRFYLHLADEFDLIAVLDQVDTRTNRSYSARRNSIQGIGTSIFDNLPPDFPPRLRGTIIFPIDGLFDAASNTLSHEWGHRWINFLDGSLADPRDAHWPLSDLAFGIMGFSDEGGQGFDFPLDLVEQADGSFLLSSREVAREFNEVELYLMGLLPEEEVGEHFVFLNQDQLGQVRAGGILQGPVDVVTIEDVIAVNGPRVPAFGDAQTAFRMATVVLTEGRLLSPSEMAFFDHMAARGEAEVELPITEGLARGITKPFFLATGARATLSTTVLDTSMGPVDIFMLLDLSGSFADDLSLFQEQAPDIISSIKASNSSVRFGLGKFEDYPIAPFGQTDPGRGDTAYQRLMDLTLDSDVVLETIANLPTPLPGDGGDDPESQLPALFQAATGAGQDLAGAGFPGASIPAGQQANFRDGATKLMLLWTDAAFHLPGDPGGIPYPGPSFTDTVNAILALDPPKVMGISSGPDAVADLEAIAAATGAVAPPDGVDCDGNGTIDIAAGEPLVCIIPSTGEGIGEAIIEIVEKATLKVIDIKPGPGSTLHNPINPKSRGLVPVAILGIADFDVTDVDVSTLAFGPAGANPAHDLTELGVLADHLRDVNGDGITDLVSHYVQRDTGIGSGDTQACLMADLAGGGSISSCDSVTVK